MDTGAPRPDLGRTADPDTPGTRHQPQLGDPLSLLETPGPDTKKRSIQAVERDTERVRQARHDDQNKISQVAFERLTFVDESGVNLAMTRRYGRAPRGQRIPDSVPGDPGVNVTLIGALSLSGATALMTIPGATTGEVFRAYVEQVLGPTLGSGDGVVMDNLRAHKVAGVAEAIAGRGARVEYLPPYSPDLSPIERCWSKLKEALRGAKARTYEALDVALAEAWESVTASDAEGWFTHCGYPI